MVSRYAIRKYCGDDLYSWAVFKRTDVKGMGTVIMYGQATPIVNACSRSEADYYKKRFEAEAEKERNKIHE